MIHVWKEKKKTWHGTKSKRAATELHFDTICAFYFIFILFACDFRTVPRLRNIYALFRCCSLWVSCLCNTVRSTVSKHMLIVNNDLPCALKHFSCTFIKEFNSWIVAVYSFESELICSQEMPIDVLREIAQRSVNVRGNLLAFAEARECIILKCIQCRVFFRTYYAYYSKVKFKF